MADASTLRIPERTTSRDEVHLVGDMGAVVAGDAVVIDGSQVRFTTQSFMDGLIKAVLVEAGAAHLQIEGLPEHAAGFCVRSAQRRGLSGRLSV